jgi:transcriptional regulator with GAF, ATPase, and Fis domain
MTTTPEPREQALSAAFVEMADTLVADYDVIDLAHRLAAHCVTLLPPVAAAGLLLTDEHDQLQLLASSNEQARLVELFQLETDQNGPCLEAFHTGAPVMVEDLSVEDHRWPGFAAQAQHHGFQAVQALPMRLREQTIGALNLFSTTPGPLADDELRLGQALADVATIGILQQRTLARHETIIEQLQGALNSRVTIEQAKGALSHRGQVDLDTAFGLLRDYARAHRMRLTELASHVTRDPVLATHVLAIEH